MKHMDVCSGIGGFALAGSWVWKNHKVIVFCEKNEFCQNVLKTHWPDVPCVPDIHDLRGDQFGAIDLFNDSGLSYAQFELYRKVAEAI